MAWSFNTNTYECWKKLKSTLAVSNNSYQLSSHLESLTERCMYIWGKNYDEAVYWLQESCWRQSSNLSFACSIIFVFTIFIFIILRLVSLIASKVVYNVFFYIRQLYLTSAVSRPLYFKNVLSVMHGTRIGEVLSTLYIHLKDFISLHTHVLL